MYVSASDLLRSPVEERLLTRRVALHGNSERSSLIDSEPKKQEPEIPPPAPVVEPERNAPEIPPDKNTPEERAPVRAKVERLFTQGA